MNLSIRHIVLRRSTAIVFIALFAGFCLAGLTIPQATNVSPTFLSSWQEEHAVLAVLADIGGLHHVYTSGPFLISCLLAFASMAYALLKVYRSIKCRVVASPLVCSEDRFSHYFTFHVATASSEQRVIDLINRNGFRAVRLSSRMVRFTKNAASLWGTVTLHVGILVLIGMGILTYAFQQRGFVQLIEGDTFFGQSSQFLESEHGPLSPPFTPDFNVSLKGITPDYYPKGNLKALRSSILISRNANLLNSAELSINEPLDLGSIRVYQSISFGKTVVLAITTSSKRFLTYYSLERPLKSGDEFTGASDIPTTPYRLDLHLNTGSPVQGVASGSPRLHLAVKIGNTLAYSGTLGIGETANLGEMKLQFIEDRQWSGLIIVDRRFIVGVFTGFILVILGLVLVYGAPYRVIFMESVVAEHARELRFGGVTRREQALFHDEFNELMEKIFLEEGKINVGTRVVEV